MASSVFEDCIFRFLPKECSPPKWFGVWTDIVDGFLSIVVVIVGLFGNIMSLVVLTHPDFQGVFDKLLIALSCFDMIFLSK